MYALRPLFFFLIIILEKFIGTQLKHVWTFNLKLFQCLALWDIIAVTFYFRVFHIFCNLFSTFLIMKVNGMNVQTNCSLNSFLFYLELGTLNGSLYSISSLQLYKIFFILSEKSQFRFIHLLEFLRLYNGCEFSHLEWVKIKMFIHASFNSEHKI